MKRLEDKTEKLAEREIKDEVRSTKSLVQVLLQTIKISQLYETNHPIILRFLENLKQEFDRYFDKLDSFSLQVGQYQFFYKGKVVYESQNVKDNLAFFFFRDGIREIHFFKDLEFREIADFLSIVRKSNIINRNEGDLVTLLWDKDFFRIDFTIIDEFLDEEGTFIPVTDEDLLKGLEYRSFDEGSFQKDSDGAKAEESQVLVAEGLKQALNLSPDQSLAQVWALNPHEMEEISKRVQQEQQPEYLYVLINNLIEILLHLDGNVDAHGNMISYFKRVIQSLLEQKEVGEAVGIFKNFKDTVKLEGLTNNQIVALHRILQIGSEASSIELLGKAMKGNGEADSESIQRYLQFLTKQAVDPLCSLFCEVESQRWKNVICDRLADLCKDDINPLAKFLSDLNPFLVSQILRILGKIGHSSTLEYLGNLISHKDSRVREETLKLITQFGEKGAHLVQNFLTDSLPEIRGKASRILARIDKDRAVKSLMEIISSEDFYGKSYEEKASFLMALAETESEEAIPILKQIAKERRWFKKGKWREMQLCAANALRKMEVGKE